MGVYLTKEKWVEEIDSYNFKRRVGKINDEIQSTLYFNACLGCPFGLWSYNSAVYTTFLNEKYHEYLNSIADYTSYLTPTAIKISAQGYEKIAKEKEETYKKLFNSNSNTLEQLGIDCVLRVFFDYTKENSKNRMIIDEKNSCKVLRDFLMTQKAKHLFNQRGFSLDVYQNGDLKYIMIY